MRAVFRRLPPAAGLRLTATASLTHLTSRLTSAARHSDADATRVSAEKARARSMVWAFSLPVGPRGAAGFLSCAQSGVTTCHRRCYECREARSRPAQPQWAVRICAVDFTGPLGWSGGGGLLQDAKNWWACVSVLTGDPCGPVNPFQTAACSRLHCSGDVFKSRAVASLPQHLQQGVLRPLDLT